MITGLKFQMQPAELRQHLDARVAHHGERANWYESKAADLVAGGVVASNMTGGDPVAALTAKNKQHTNLARLFQWMRDHVVDEPYELNDADLQRLEILDRGW